MPPLSDQEIGPELRALGLEHVSGWGRTAVWKGIGSEGKSIQKSQSQWANDIWAEESPYYTPTSKTVQGADGMLYEYTPGQPLSYIEGQPYPSQDAARPDASGQTALLPDGSGYGYITYGPKGASFATDPDGNFIVAKPLSSERPGGFAPQYDSFTDRRGNRIFTTNGQVTSTIPGADWEKLSPTEQFRMERDLQTQGEAADMARQVAGDEADMRRAQLEESGRRERFGVENEETGVMNRATLAESARASNLRSATDAFGDLTRVAPQLGQLALSNAEFTRDVLKNAPDYLARAFFQQGKTSPLPQVSQADIINQLRSNISGFNSTLQGFNPQVGSYQAPAAYRGFAAPATAPANVAQMAPTAAAPAFNPYDKINRIAALQNASNTNTAGFNSGANATPGGDPLDTPRFAGGGFTNEPMMRVGESPSGAPNATEETVLNPTEAPIGVVPNPATAESPDMKKHQQAHDGIAKIIGFVSNTKLQHELVDEMAKHAMPEEMPRFAYGTMDFGFAPTTKPAETGFAPTTKPAQMGTTKYSNPQVQQSGFGNYQTGQPLAGSSTMGNWYDSPYLNANTAPGTRQTISGSGIMSDYANPTEQQRALYNSWNSGAFVNSAPAGMNFAQWVAAGQPSGGGGGGTGGFGFSVPSLPTPDAANQDAIKALEIANRPPAVDAILNGRMARTPKFGFELFTPQQYRSLTPDDRAALGTALATQYNETLPNVEFAMSQRFGPTRQRQAAGQVAGFAR